MKSIEFYHAPKSVQQSCCSVLVILTDMGLVQDLSLVLELCSSSGASKSDRRILSTSGLNTGLATHLFALRLSPSTPPPLLLFELSFSRRKQGSSASHVRIIARQRRPLRPETSTGPCQTAPNHEIHKILSCDEILSTVLRAQHFD